MRVCAGDDRNTAPAPVCAVEEVAAADHRVVVAGARTDQGHWEAIAKCLPDTIAAYVDWVIRDSQWKVRDTTSQELVPIESQHIAILFRRFMSWGTDVTRNYVHALEARHVPHLLWGARSFHQREEIETVRAALNAIERPAMNHPQPHSPGCALAYRQSCCVMACARPFHCSARQKYRG
jgi:hypothetical protein